MIFRPITVPSCARLTLDQWAYEHGVRLQFIEPEQAGVQNAHIESFNARLREECLE